MVRTEGEIDWGRAAARVSQVVDYVFYVIYALIGLEILLELLGVRETNSFQLKVSYLVAFLVYVMLHLAVSGLLRMMAH